MGFNNVKTASGNAVLLADNASRFDALVALFEKVEFSLEKISAFNELLDLSPALILIDACADKFNDHTAQCAKLFPKTHIVGLVDNASMTTKINALTLGAHDVWDISQPDDDLFRQLSATINYSNSSAITAHTEPQTGPDFEGFVGQSEKMQDVYRQIKLMSASDASVFISGESGVGKEISAEALHALSSRSDNKFVAINCGAIPKDLMEAELFGVAKGAYTGANEDRLGSAELADGGTLFLDEIGELELPLQAKLLRFLQTGSINRVGDPVAKKLDVRIICATNIQPLNLVNEGKLRADLYYRLNILPLELPSLKERAEDIGQLTRHFMQYFSAQENKTCPTLSDEASIALISYEWPGNVRQLQNMIRRAVILNDCERIELSMLNFDDETSAVPQAAPAISSQTQDFAITPLWRQEQDIIDNAISAFNGNIAKAARALEISPSTIYRKMEHWRTKVA